MEPIRPIQRDRPHAVEPVGLERLTPVERELAKERRERERRRRRRPPEPPPGRIDVRA
jgi:hypothetical protein